MTTLVDEKGRPKQPLPVEYLLHRLVGGDLAEDGIQWSPEVVTVDADTNYEVLNIELDDTVHQGSIVELEFVLSLALKAGSATADVNYLWQAKSSGGSDWVDLHSVITKADINTTYQEYTVSGYRIAAVTNLDKYPLSVRLLVQSNETTPGVATAKVKNSAYVRIKLV
jgi:hypothetical protein